MKRTLVVLLGVLGLLFVIGCNKAKEEKKADKPKEEPKTEAKADPAPAPAEPAPAPVADPAPAPVAEPAPAPAVTVKMADLKFGPKEGWEGEYNEALETWTWEKYTPNADGTNDPNRVYINLRSDEQPLESAAFAEKLKEDGFLDIGYKYTEVRTQTPLPNGWVIEGTQQSTSDAEDKEDAFVVLVDVAGAKIVCRSGTFKNVDARTEAIELCKALAF